MHGHRLCGMSNLERDPRELLCDPDAPGTRSAIEILTAREVPLGGPRAMTVRRTLPQRGRTTIGAWCFIDHYGPDDVAATGGMVVPPHPHTGLQTVSWLFEGEIEHRDSAGSHAMVRPGELNLMTAGTGIQHSEVSTPAATTLHGVQLWTVLPDASRHASPFFERHEAIRVSVDDADVRVFVGALAGVDTGVTVFSPLVGAQVDLPPFGAVTLEVEPGFEHGVLVDAGPVRVESAHGDDAVGAEDAAPSELAYVPPGARSIRLSAGEAPARVLLLGGEPFGEQIVMWWNFIGRTHDEVVAYREQWQREVVAAADAQGRFGHVDGYDGDPLPAPDLPTVRLKPRG